MSESNSELNDEMCQITLPPILDIPAAADLKETVLEKVTPGINLTLHSDEVEQITTPGIQMLMAIVAHIADQKANLTVVKPSDVLVDGFNDLGLFSQLMAWNIE